MIVLTICSGSGIFNSSNPEAYARAIVEATTHYNNPLKIAEVSTGLGAGMKGENDLNREGLISESPILHTTRPMAGGKTVGPSPPRRLLLYPWKERSCHCISTELFLFSRNEPEGILIDTRHTIGTPAYSKTDSFRALYIQQDTFF